MGTTLTGATIVASNTDPAPTNVVVTPSNGSDGTYTWRAVGQRDTGSNSIITFSVSGKASNPVITNPNIVKATCQANPVTHFVRVTATFTAPSNKDNWTIYIGATGGGNVRFVRGSG